MTTKEWLSRGRRLEARIEELKAETAAEFEKAISSVGHAAQDKVQMSNGNRSENRMIQYVHYSLELQRKADELMEIKTELLRAINAVSDPILSELLFLRYIKNMTWEQIAEKLGYSVRSTHRLHGVALLKIEKSESG